MELELHEDRISEDVAFDVADYIDDTAFENEKCGICMDVIVDRGVLDCCDHWFCFACIDNWATITNLCPLCKCEFQLITCIPVYDTIGNSKLGEDSLSRDDDWCIQGKNNTLSFPSYYIDENAVICLDGDGCKLRSGLVTTEEGLTLDTSIACDSCDLWYHAFCVGFDPESTSENSWLCPRCKIDEVPLESDGVLVQRASGSEQCGHESTDFACPMEDAFSGKVLVSVADAGETAVVVSMVEGKQWTGASENFPLKKLDGDSNEKPVISSDEKPVISSDANTDTVKTEVQLNDTVSCSIYGKDGTVGALARDNQDNPEMSFNISPQRTTFQSNINEQETLLSLSLSRDASLFLPGDSSSFSDLKTDTVNKGLCKPSGPNGCKVSSPPLLDAFCTTSRPSESESNIDLHLGLHVGASLLVDKTASDATGNQLAEHEQKPSVESSLSVDKMAGDDAIENIAGVTCQKNLEVSGVKRKHTDRSRDDAHMTDYAEGKETSAKIQMGTEIPAKKAKSDENSKTAPLKCRVDASISNGSREISRPAALSKDDKLKHIRRKEATATNIMSIVQGNDRRSSKAPAHPNSEEKSTKEGDNVAGLRIKKIMRRVADNESSTLLQKLRQEIREAVRNKSSKDPAKSDFLDTQLLTAFRAAVVKPQNEPTPKINPSVIRAKKVMLQKGKIREKLTKKIYGTASGRRRHAWDRDWEVEFWKHRCTRTQPEKVQTLRSVLDLLKRSSQSCSESSEMEQGPEGEAKNSILSRLYLADASVFPRKEDIKPLSALRGSAMTGNHEQEENNLSNESQKVNKSVRENHVVETSAPTRSSTQDRVPSCDNTGKRSIVPSFKGEASCRKAHPKGMTGPASISMSNGSKCQAQTIKENPGRSDDLKSDKRKWALEVLARKTASVNRNAAQGKEEDNSALKGTYPLLAQLPADMRPVLAPIRHSKVPISVRQAQLYRLTEHYLRKTNLPVMHRTAGTELAVADAVNVEKEICDKSNSKLVYVNLCSQVLSQRTNNSELKTAETTASCPEASPAKSSEHVAIESFSDPTAATCENVEEALKMAGFLSDSPPNSPSQAVKNLNDKDAPSEKVAEEGVENVFDIDSHPDLDIYGDFEYDLGDEDYVGPSSIASALRVSNLQSEDGDLKMKVVFSTINCEKTCLALDSNDNAVKQVQNEVVTSHHEKPGIVEAPIDSPSVLKCHTDRGMESSILELKIDAPCLSPKTHDSERSEEPSLAECEELYGPDKEPLVDEIYDKAMSEPNKCREKEATAENTVPVGKENHRSNKGAAADTEFVSESSKENNIARGGIPFNHDSSRGENSPNHSENAPRKEAKSNSINQSDLCHSITKKVEAYVKEHIRPLCKSGVITAEQYRWAVGKTTEKVMKYHSKAKNANFLIKEGDKVKKLAEQYVEAAPQK